MKLSRIKAALSRDKQGILDRITQYTKIDPVSGCHLWTGSKNNMGYGELGLTYFTNKINTVLVHRLQYCIHNPNSMTDDIVILHDCDTPHCINIEHLKHGTMQDNISDCIRKGRRVVSIKLTEDRVNDLKQLYATGKYTQKFLANKFKIDQSCVSYIVNNKRRINA